MVNLRRKSEKAIVQVRVRMHPVLWKATRRLAVDKDTSGHGVVIPALQEYIKRNGCR